MLILDLKFKSKLNEEGLQPKLYKIYVDDSNLAWEVIKEGFRIVRKEDRSVKVDRKEGEVDREKCASKGTTDFYVTKQTCPICEDKYWSPNKNIGSVIKSTERIPDRSRE